MDVLFMLSIFNKLDLLQLRTPSLHGLHQERQFQ